VIAKSTRERGREPFIQVGNLYFVPTVRQRLAFAVTVRRAVVQMHSESRWDPEKDVIAVSLPESLAPHVREAINKFPRVSLLLARLEDENAREVIPVVPSDAMVEAIRIAFDQQIPLEYLDLEIAPGNLTRSPCAQDPDWPDETLVHKLGADNYLSMIEGYYAQPPARMEPIDSWREFTITEKLRRLQVAKRRALVVCDAGLVRSIIAKLKSNPFRATVEEPSAGRIRYKNVTNLKLDILLRYLGDYPKLVERFNQYRGEFADESMDMFQADFEENTVLRDLVLECSERARDLEFSMRQHKAFGNYLKNLLRLSKRLLPRPDTLYSAAAGCMGIGFAERLHCFLCGYDDLIKVERVKQNSKSEASAFSYQVAYEANQSGIWGRTCTPHESPYQSTRIPKRKKRNNKESELYRWLPEVQFMRRMYKKVRQTTFEMVNKQTIGKYQGSSQMGLEVRKTIRASRMGYPNLFVKEFSRTLEPISTENEPHIWILNPNPEVRGLFITAGIGHASESKISFQSGAFWIGKIDVFEEKPIWGLTQPVDPESHPELRFLTRCGWMNFAYDFDGKDEAVEAYGDKFERRVPNHGNFSHPRGCVDEEFEELAASDASWVEVALLTGLKYAKDAIVVIAPPNFVVPSSIKSSPLARGKEIVFVSLNEFSRDQQQKLSKNYLYQAPPGSDDDAESMLRIIMRGYWK